MSTAVSMPRLPSMSEIEKSLREKLPGLTIYNPSQDWIQLEVFGLTHLYACPDLNGAVEPHPITGTPTACDGRTIIRGRWLTQKDSSGKLIDGQDAPAMVKLIVGPEKYGQMGFVWLPGTSVEEDEKLKAASRSVFHNYQNQRDEMIVAKRVEFKQNWMKGPRKSEPCPPPTPAETNAMDHLQQRKREATYKYECEVPDCPGYSVNEWERFAAHMKAAHDITPKREKYDGEVSGLKETPPPTTESVSASPIAAAAEKLKAEDDEGFTVDDEKPDIPRPRKKSR